MHATRTPQELAASRFERRTESTVENFLTFLLLFPIGLGLLVFLPLVLTLLALPWVLITGVPT